MKEIIKPIDFTEELPNEEINFGEENWDS